MFIVLTGLSVGNVVADDSKSFDPPKNKFGKSIYPFVPVTTDYIKERTRVLTEDTNYILNFNDIIQKGLSERNTQTALNPGIKPWMSTYWPLNKGLIADPYKPKRGLRLSSELSPFGWKKNYRKLKRRQRKVLTKWDQLSNEELEKLAPSEKYDILLGDSNFTLTKKVVQYMHDWGTKKDTKWISKIDKVGADTLGIANSYVANGWVNSDNVPFATVEEAYILAKRLRGGLTDAFAKMLMDKGEARSLESALTMAKPMAIAEQKNFVLKPVSQTIKSWEGVCHGWSTAAGNVPRPRKTVSFKLPNGKTLKFFPDDMKALVSYLWANSLVQDPRTYNKQKDTFSGGGILSQGLKCNDNFPKKDPWGRIYDDKPDEASKELEPRCVGVHPALWHLGLVNVIGKQGRSFVVERKISKGVDNHPMYGYKATYFNPYTGEYDEPLSSKVVKITDEDQFKAFRNKEATHVVGVRLTMTYINWKRAKRLPIDDESMDSTRDIDMIYDLELNKNGDIVGGQWRATETGRGNMFNAERKQPDFFWVVTKDYKQFFKGNQSLPEWKNGNQLPPSEYLQASILASNQKYYSTPEFGWHDRCTVIRKKKTKLNKKIFEEQRVNCEHIYERPQPLLQVVNKLIEMAQ